MKVLVTDYAWNDLNIEKEILGRARCELVVAKEGTENELEALAGDVDGILTNWKRVSEKVIAASPRCKAIGRYGIGLDNIDVRYATSVGIVVTNVPVYCLEEVTEHVMAMLLSLARKVTFFDRAIKHGKYDLSAETPMFRVKGKTLGIVGYGSIGRLLAEKARAFGLRVVVYTRSRPSNPVSDSGIEFVSFEDLLRASDFISVHVPLSDLTHQMFRYEVFKKMKPTAFFINTSRGGIVDGNGLLRALNEGVISGAGLDVFAPEPPDPADPLILHPRVIASPHAAFNSEESLQDLRSTSAFQMLSLLSNRIPESVVNPEVLQQSNLRIRPGGESAFTAQS